MAKTPQIPGDIPVDSPGDPVPDPAGGETVTVDKAQLDAIMAQLSDLQAKVAAGQGRMQPQPENLPDQSEVDAAAIKVPVLTKQGWVVPSEFGSNPAAKRL